MRNWVALAIALVALPAAAAERIVTLGSAVTETAFALGLGESIVGVDQSSQHPETARKLPQVGYYRTVAAEGILSLRPTLVVASAEAGPQAALDLVRAAGVEVLVLPAEPTLPAARERIIRLAARGGKEEAAKALQAAIDAALARAEGWISCVRKAAPKALFLFARGGNSIAAAGRETAADSILSLAGATNAFGSAFSGYRPLGAEAFIAAAPEVIVTTTHALEAMGGREAALAIPGIAQTPAGRAKRLVVIEDQLLLGFGPRVGEAVAALAQGLGEGRCD